MIASAAILVSSVRAAFFTAFTIPVLNLAVSFKRVLFPQFFQ